MTDWPDLLGPPEVVAPRLLGAVLRHGEVAVRLTEVEAYAGTSDPGSHAYRGSTPRTASMFGPPGRLYCYFTYGMHVCANVVIGEEGVAAAVLMRGGAVIAGPDVARERRPGVRDRALARGPACLCRALGIVLSDDGADLADGPITLELTQRAVLWESGPRTGLRLAPDRPWRFWTPGEPSVSLHRRHPRAAAESSTPPDLA